GTGRTVPFDFARRARRRRHRIARIDADAQAIAEPKAVAGVIEVIACDARAPADMVSRHRRKRGGTKISLAVERSAVQQHLPKAREIRGGGNQSATAGFPSRDIERSSLDMLVLAQRPGIACPLNRFGQKELGRRHSQRIEQLAFFKLVDRLAGADLDDAAEY